MIKKIIFVWFVMKINQIQFLCHADMVVYVINVLCLYGKMIKDVIYVGKELNNF